MPIQADRGDRCPDTTLASALRDKNGDISQTDVAPAHRGPLHQGLNQDSSDTESDVLPRSPRVLWVGDS